MTKEEFKLYQKEWNKINSDRIKAKASAWAKENLDKVKAHKRKYAENNRDKVNAATAKRRAAKLQATPPWLTKEQFDEIKNYYSLAKELQWLSEETLEVDHIIPLQGENVSGLHVPWNLQVLPRSLNISKSNKLHT